MEFAALVEEVGRHSGALSLLLIVQAVGTLPIVRREDFPRRGEVLDAVAHKGLLLGFALTESRSGSDAYSLRTEVEGENGRLCLTGAKHMITNGGVAHAYVVFVIHREPALRQVCAYLVDAEARGVRAGKPQNLIGMHGIPTTDLRFEKVALDLQDRIGGPNDGYVVATDTLNLSRPWIAAQAVGLARGALETALRFACARHVMGGPLIDKQGIRFMVAEISAAIEASAALVERTSRKIDAGREDYTADSAMCKLFATERAVWACERAVQILGGVGCVAGNRAERAFRDAKITQIYEGANEIQKILISRELVRRIRNGYPCFGPPPPPEVG